MRRKQCEVRDSEQIEWILGQARIGHLATIGSDGYPYITPVNFVYHNGNIYFHSATTGEKLDNLKSNPNVCFQVDIPLAYLDSGFDPDGGICRLHQFYHCVIIRGLASLVEDDDIKAQCLNALVRKHERRIDHEPVMTKSEGFSRCVVVAIEPTSITAKTDLFQYKSTDIRNRLAKYLTERNAAGDPETLESLIMMQQEP
ncbi:MAG: pyridoxamine 5'-phosphate oxidase family protein [Desulfomonilaceae bacterium]